MGKRKILIIDDDQELDEAVKLALEETGEYEVAWENHGAEGCNAARRCHPDLILLDLHIPDVPGGEVERALMEDAETKYIPVVYFTVLVSKDEVRSNGGLVCGRPCIAKPVSAQELIRCIESYLSES